MMIARITPHPDQEPGAVLCSYECVCRQKIDSKECWIRHTQSEQFCTDWQRHHWQE
jgi:hypothetical protein